MGRLSPSKAPKDLKVQAAAAGSALVKRYVPERVDFVMDYLMTRVDPSRLLCLNIGALETFSIIVRARNAGRISSPESEDLASLQVLANTA